MKNKPLITVIFVIFGFILISVSANKVFAATRTWDADFNQQWTTPENWDGDTLPNSGDDLVFPGGAFFISVDCDFITDTYASIAFGDNYNMSCTSLHVTNGVTISTGSVDFQPQLILEGDLLISISDGTTLTLGSGINLNGHNLTLDAHTTGIVNVNGSIVGNGNITNIGMGPVIFAHANSFLGNITVNNGELRLNAANATGDSSNIVTVGDGVIIALLTSNIDNSITPGTAVQIDDQSSWSILGFDQSARYVTGLGTIITDTGSVLTLEGTSFNSANVFEGDGDISLVDSGAVYISGNGTAFTGKIFANGNTQLSVTGSWSFGQQIHLSDGAILFGQGNGATFVDTDGTATYSPSRFGLDSTHTLTGAEFDFAPGDTVSLVIAGASTYDSIFNYGFGPDLTGVVLSLSLTYTPVVGDSYTLLSADGGITGTFSGLPNGSRIDVGGYNFRINYSLGSVTLTVIAVADNSQFIAFPPPVTSDDAFDIMASWFGSFGIPTGTAELFNGSTSLGVVSLINGDVTFHFSSLPAGNYNLTVHYSGDGTYPASTSNVLSMTILQGLIVQSPGLSSTGVNVPINLIIISLIFSFTGIIFINRKYYKH